MILEIFQSPKNKQYFFRIKARNGRIIAQSEGYKRKQAIEKLLKRNGWRFTDIKDLTK